MEEPLDINQAARLLGLKKGTIYNMVSRKTIPYHKVGRRVLFLRSELEPWFRGTLVPCISSAQNSSKLQRKNPDVEAIVKDAVEEYTRG